MVYFDESQKTLEDVIQNCTQLIERSTMVAGVGNKMRNPLLSIFLGKEATAHIPLVQSTYFSCWSAEARKLITVQGSYSRDEISKHLADASRVCSPYMSKSTLRIVWYWDIMDDDFEQQFACVKQDISGPVGMQVAKHLFVFCSQQDYGSQKKTEDRLKRLIDWNKDAKIPMMILSDATRQGLLEIKGVTESYHMAASVILMLNSAPKNPGTDMGIQLDFWMRKRPFWTASYCACSKNFFDIIGVSLLAIIRRYQEMGKRVVRSSEVQSRICGDGGNYITFLDDVFEKLIVSKCPAEQQIAFWADLPYTQDMGALERKLAGKQEQPNSRWGRLFKKSDSSNLGNAISSVRDFWDLCVTQYYVKPVREWLDSPEGTKMVMNYMYEKMAMALTLSDMSTQLSAEWEKIEREPLYQDIAFSYPQEGSTSLPAYLHSCACVEVKRQIYGTLLIKLRDIMKELSQNSDGFETLLTNVADSLLGIQMDPCIERAYGNHMNRIIEANTSVLNQKIHPCATEAELLGQLEQVFEELVRRDQDRVYYYTLQEDIDFQIQAGISATNNVIANCFNFDMSRAGRLVTLTTEPGQLFCMMNDKLRGLIEDRDIGTQFIVNRCDRIERLYLYPVLPETIQYR